LEGRLTTYLYSTTVDGADSQEDEPMEQETIAEEMESQDNAEIPQVRCVTYLPADVYRWAQKLVEQLGNVDRKATVSEIIRESVMRSAREVEAEVTAIVELRKQGVRT